VVFFCAHIVYLRDEQVRAVLREDRRDETAMKKRIQEKKDKEKRELT